MPTYPHPRGPFTVLSSTEKYRNKWINVREDQVTRPDGKPGLFGVVAIQPGVAIVALDNDHNIYLVETFCYANNVWLLEVPGGGIDIQESPLAAAQRELAEETSLQAQQWQELGMYAPLHLISAPITMFLADQVTSVALQVEPDGEPIRLVKLPFAEAVAKVLSGQITDGVSQCAILKAARYLGR